MTTYAVMIVGDADRWWTTMTPEERAHGYAEYGRFSATLGQRGHQITGGAELHASAQTKRLAPGATDTVSASEGPFAESVEQVGGFFLVDTEDPKDLLECCTILTALGDGVEVRPVVRPEERTG